MNAYAITIPFSEQSEASTERLRNSHRKLRNEFPLDVFWAVTPKDVKPWMEEYGVRWDYPWEGELVCGHTGLKLHAYRTRNRLARMACFMSHYRLWEKAAASGEPLLILEDDALFIERLVPGPILATRFGAIGINDPRGATRKAQVFHDQVVKQPQAVCSAPYVDDPAIPQGLAGASAYLIKPWAAQQLIDKVREIGAWPNDALMCRQIFDWLGVTKTYYTKVQGTPSVLA